ncbi:MAG: hypothetical protein Q9168_007647 [Polycauliona sp. 1 TL-2023]
MDNLYIITQVPEHASDQYIQRAYEWFNGSQVQATPSREEINIRDAFLVLLDPEQRMQYDRELANERAMASALVATTHDNGGLLPSAPPGEASGGPEDRMDIDEDSQAGVQRSSSSENNLVTHSDESDHVPHRPCQPSEQPQDKAGNRGHDSQQDPDTLSGNEAGDPGPSSSADPNAVSETEPITQRGFSSTEMEASVEDQMTAEEVEDLFEDFTNLD